MPTLFEVYFHANLLIMPYSYNWLTVRDTLGQACIQLFCLYYYFNERGKEDQHHDNPGYR